MLAVYGVSPASTVKLKAQLCLEELLTYKPAETKKISMTHREDWLSNERMEQYKAEGSTSATIPP